MPFSPVPPAISLVPMSLGRAAEFAEMLNEYRAAGEQDTVYKGDHAIAWQGYAAFYGLVSRMKLGGYPRPEIVPTDPYFIQESGIEENGRILGELNIRHHLSPQLEKFGGHVGYKVRPSARNRGVATAALRLALQKLAVAGVEQALLTCHNDNAASIRVIEKCGGVRIADSATQYGIERRYLLPTFQSEKI